MHIAIISCVFPPEPIVSANTSFQIANELNKMGNDVSVVTSFPSRPGGKIYTGFSQRIFNIHHNEGIKIVRSFSVISRKSSMSSRFTENISFGITSSFVLLFMRKPDVIYSNSWPVFATGFLIIIAKLRKIPVVCSIQDIYPESLISQKRSNINPILIKILHLIDNWNAINSKALIVISNKFSKIYMETRRVPEERIFVIPNWGSEMNIKAKGKENFIRMKYNISKKDFLLVFGGNVGVAAGVENIIRIMEYLPINIKLLIAGEGSQLDKCKEIAKKFTNDRILFHTPWHIDETEHVLNAADLCVLPTLGNQAISSVPSKLISYLFAKRPVLAIANLNSEISEIINNSGCGWAIEPNQTEKIISIVKKITILSKEELMKRGLAGYKYAIENYHSDKNIPRVLNVIIDSVATH